MTVTTVINNHGVPANVEEIRAAQRLQYVAKTCGRSWSLQETFNMWEDLSEDFLPGSGWLRMPRDDRDLWNIWRQFEDKKLHGK